MTSYIENKLSPIYVSLFITTEIAFIVGSMTHVYIIAVYVTDWRKGRTMSSDQVTISIMISRMILQSVIQLNLFWELFCTVCSPIYYSVIMNIIFFSSIYSSFWLSTLLCVIFYLKISNIHGVFFLWMKTISSKRILHFITASFMVSIGQMSVVYLVYFASHTYFVALNSTLTTQLIYDPRSAVFYINTFGPLLISLLSSLFLITSLYLHIKHMRCNRNVTSSLDPYYRIIKYTTGSLFIYVSCVIITVLAEKYYNILGFVLISFPWTISGTIHSMLLIYVTPKLKNPFSGILQFLSNCWIKREEPGDLAMTSGNGDGL